MSMSMGALSRLPLRQLAPPLINLAIIRSYHLAAQIQFDYDDNDNDNKKNVTGPCPCPCVAVDRDDTRGVQWVFIGNPNAKKHVYAQMIANLLHVPRISISSLLRQDLSPHSPLYKQITEAVNRRQLVPESILFGLLSKRLEDGHCRGENGFILDGIPRTRLQAEILDELVDIDLVVNFKCRDDHLKPADSSASRDQNKSSFSNFANGDHEPKVSAFYKEQMQFLEDYYQTQKKLIDFQVGNAPGENWKGLLAALHLQHRYAAVHSSQMRNMGFRLP